MFEGFSEEEMQSLQQFSNEFMKIFCGISKRRNKDQMKRYGKYIRPCWYAFILGPLLMLTEVAGEVLLPSLWRISLMSGQPIMM